MARGSGLAGPEPCQSITKMDRAACRSRASLSSTPESKAEHSTTMVDLKSCGLIGMGGLALVLFGAQSNAQNFTQSAGLIPATGSSTENNDFGDVEIDGDWDAILADGGDAGNDQNRIYINQGHLQGGTTGVFLDETATRFPVVSTDGRDIEFGDFDTDGDLDIYTSNTSNFSNQSNHWWINRGFLQGGQLGFYVDQTAARWLGLGGAGSSIAPATVLGGGGFIDWSCDCDFGDLDNDGDLDLVHSTYGGVFAGDVPTRLFLNNGLGFFTEFNPSGFQLTGTTIANGNPGIWSQGTQQQNTTNMTGAQCDIATSTLDIQVGDTDGDLDLDILHGDRNQVPRMFKNRLEENGGSTLAFRDVTGAAGAGTFPAGYASGANNYEEEMGDMDKDGDLDVYGLNWPGLNDVVMNNIGDGTFNNLQTLASSGNDDNEGDFIDYDSDGDLDLIIAAFASTNRLYRNDYAGGGPGAFSYTFIVAATSGLTASRSLDGDIGDTDADGDYDWMTSEDSGQNEKLFINNSTANDTTAPYIPHVTDVGNQTAAAGTLPVRAHVYDNAAYYVTWYNPTVLEVTVDGCRVPDLKAITIQGNMFRAQMPKNLLGSVSAQWRSTDEHGNTGTSAADVWTGSYGPAFTGTIGAGSLGSIGTPGIKALSVPFPGSTIYLAGDGLPAGTQWWMAITSAAMPSAPLYVPGLCNVNVSGTMLYFKTGLADAAGCGSVGVPISGSVPPGATAHAQFFGLNGVAGDLLSSSVGLSFTVQ